MSDLTIYGEIGWDVTNASFYRSLSEVAPGSVTLRINSPGGSVFDGIGIGSLVSNHGNVTAIVDALCASAATIPFVRAKRRIMSAGSMMMIHQPWSVVSGTSDDMNKEASVLQSIGAEMAKLYADASGGKLSAKDAEKLMDAETWLTAEQAVEIGLADAIEGKAKAFASIDKNRHAYRNIPKGLETMSTETPEAKPSFLDRIVASITVDTSAIKAELAEAQNAIVDAVAKIADAEARASEAVAALATAKAEHTAEVEALKVAHVAALEAAKIEGGQEAVKEVLEASAPEALPHAETVEGAEASHTAKYNALRAAGKYAEAGVYRKAHKLAILKGE
jgi:ATP-dependent Clp protease, protease subunit